MNDERATKRHSKQLDCLAALLLVISLLAASGLSGSAHALSALDDIRRLQELYRNRFIQELIDLEWPSLRRQGGNIAIEKAKGNKSEPKVAGGRQQSRQHRRHSDVAQVGGDGDARSGNEQILDWPTRFEASDAPDRELLRPMLAKLDDELKTMASAVLKPGSARWRLFSGPMERASSSVLHKLPSEGSSSTNSARDCATGSRRPECLGLAMNREAHKLEESILKTLDGLQHTTKELGSLELDKEVANEIEPSSWLPDAPPSSRNIVEPDESKRRRREGHSDNLRLSECLKV